MRHEALGLAFGVSASRDGVVGGRKRTAPACPGGEAAAVACWAPCWWREIASDWQRPREKLGWLIDLPTVRDRG